MQHLRCIPIDTDLPSPSEIMFNCPDRTHFSSYHPTLVDQKQTDINDRLQVRRGSMIRYHDRNAGPELAPLHAGQRVRILNKDTHKWCPEEVVVTCAKPHVFNYGIIRCKSSFNSIYRSCNNKLPAGVNKICGLLRFGIFCNLIKLVPTLTGLSCDARTAVNQGFGENFETANQAQQTFNQNFKVEANYKMISSDEPLELKTGEDVAKGMTYQFNRRRQWLDLAVLIVKRLMAFMFLLVVYSAYSYQRNFLTRIEFDNIYMTAYFRRIDARRYAQGKMTVLPLKKIELSELLHPFSPVFTKAERKKLLSSMLQTAVRAFIFGMIIFVDYVIYSILDIIARQSAVTYRQVGRHSIGMKVTGNGVISRLMRSFLGSFNTQHDIDIRTSNEECLPSPTVTPSSVVFAIYSVLGVVWLMALSEAYALRLRRAICAFFYRKVPLLETVRKKRILHLYNSTLKKRHGFLKHARIQMRRKAQERRIERATSLLNTLRHKFPSLCFCIAVLGLGKETCLICGDAEDRNFHFCSTPGCHFGYCGDCWKDIERRCYACRHHDDWDTESEPDSDDDVMVF
ncbi:Protein sneaky [Lamellibrachia satsuma]|nr:Protein sneaky [Lamellibrachia satsuma]